MECTTFHSPSVFLLLASLSLPDILRIIYFLKDYPLSIKSRGKVKVKDLQTCSPSVPLPLP